MDENTKSILVAFFSGAGLVSAIVAILKIYIEGRADTKRNESEATLERIRAKAAESKRSDDVVGQLVVVIGKVFERFDVVAAQFDKMIKQEEERLQMRREIADSSNESVNRNTSGLERNTVAVESLSDTFPIMIRGVAAESLEAYKATLKTTEQALMDELQQIKNQVNDIQGELKQMEGTQRKQIDDMCKKLDAVLVLVSRLIPTSPVQPNETVDNLHESAV